MDVDSLEKKLQKIVGEGDVRPLMKTIAHWMKKVKDEGNFENEDDIKSLKKIGELGIFNIEDKESKIHISLNKEGEELSKDFFMKGYYL